MNYRKKVKGFKEIKNYLVNSYDCNVVINGRWFIELLISQYYKTKPGRSTVNDKIIQELVKELNKLSKKIKFVRDNEYFSYNRLYVGYRAYNLVWDYDEENLTTTLLIINCHREKEFDKK